MTFTIALAQCARPADGNVVANVRRWAERAAGEGADLVVFPEALMTRYDGSPEAFAACSEPVDGPFAQAVDAIARELGLWIVYTMNERGEADGAAIVDGDEGAGEGENARDAHPGDTSPGTTAGAAAGAPMRAGTFTRPFNTTIITDAAGSQRGRYRKVHLFDAQGYRESDYLAAGSAPMQPVEAPFATIGCAICFDLRFPSVSLAAALDGAQVMVYPAAWVAGERKIEQWETLLRARAIECGMFVAGVSSVDANRIGHSCVFAPDGAPLAIGPDGVEALVIAEIDLAEIDRVRMATPVLHLQR